MTGERTSDGRASEQTVPNPTPSVRAGGGAPSDRTSPWRLALGDCVAEMRKMPEASVDAIVTDPPYGLEFLGKEWDRLAGDVVEDPAGEGGFQDGSGGNPYSRSRIRYGTKGDADGFRRSGNPADAGRADVFGRTSRTGPEYKTGNWQAGGGFSVPGIGERNIEWPSFSATGRFGAANPTCAKCGGRLRGAKKCVCPTPEWKPIGKRRDPANEGLPDDVTGSGMGRHMNAMQAWHHAWAVEAYRVLKPGGHLLAFGGTRTYHRLACALEDAGFEIRDQVHWIYFSGFPKNLDVSAAIDAHLGAERDKVRVDATLVRNPKSIRSGHGIPGGDRPWIEKAREVGFHEMPSKEPVTAEAKRWAGYGTALKPAHEPIVLARKPLDGTVAGNVLKHGTGALNIDAARVPYANAEDHEALVEGRKAERTIRAGGVAAEFGMAPEGLRATEQSPLGRWPANLVMGHSPDCTGKTCVPGCPVAELDRQAGTLRSGGGTIRRSQADNWSGGWPGGNEFGAYGDQGPASRFIYVAKPSRYERDAGLYDEKLAFSFGPMSGRGQPGLKCAKCGKWKMSGNPCACPEPDFRPTSFERPRIANTHPTVKPVDLMRWLVRLVTPPGGLVLDPFAGSGTTGIACLLENVRFVGIEKDPTYAEIARRRIAHAERFPWDLDPSRAKRLGLSKIDVRLLAATRPLTAFAPKGQPPAGSP